jgi:hypothetical protein
MRPQTEALQGEYRAAYRRFRACKLAWEKSGKREPRAMHAALVLLHSIETKLLAATGRLQYPPKGEKPC